MALTIAIDNHTFKKSCAGHHEKGIAGCLYILDKSFLDSELSELMKPVSTEKYIQLFWYSTRDI